MASLQEISAAYHHKQQLARRLEALQEETKAAKVRLQESQIRCEKENLDMRKFEGNDFKQFWLKLRGQYEARVLENNERAAAAMRALNDAQSHVFDMEQECGDVARQIALLDGIESAYEQALAMHVEHLDYSVHREEIIRMQEKIAHEGYQLKLLAEARNIAQLAQRKAAALLALLRAMDEDAAKKRDEREQVKVISEISELRIQLHQLEQTLAGVDAFEAEMMHFSERLTVNTLDLFFSQSSSGLQRLAEEKALRELRQLKDALVDCEQTVMHLVVEMEATQSMHQSQLENFINETTV